MIPEQKRLIEEFQALNHLSYRKDLADSLGIERTRYFRILNGAEMRLSEYLAMKKIVDGGLSPENYDSNIEELGPKMRRDLLAIIYRAKRMKQIVEKSHLKLMG